MKNICKLETAGFATWVPPRFWAPSHHSKEPLILVEVTWRRSERSSVRRELVAHGLGCRQRLEAKANRCAFSLGRAAG
jgi:hypothetical protein